MKGWVTFQDSREGGFQDWPPPSTPTPCTPMCPMRKHTETISPVFALYRKIRYFVQWQIYRCEKLIIFSVDLLSLSPSIMLTTQRDTQVESDVMQAGRPSPRMNIKRFRIKIRLSVFLSVKTWSVFAPGLIFNQNPPTCWDSKKNNGNKQQLIKRCAICNVPDRRRSFFMWEEFFFQSNNNNLRLLTKFIASVWWLRILFSAQHLIWNQHKSIWSMAISEAPFFSFFFFFQFFFSNPIATENNN